MKRILAFTALVSCLLAQAGETDFPVELLGDLNGQAVPRLSKSTTGALVKGVANSIIATKTDTKAKKKFIHAVGELLEIVDKSDFVQLWRDFGYEFYSGSTTSRKIDITGFYNASGAPTMNNAVSRVFNVCQGPLGNARSDLEGILGLNWYNTSFELDITVVGIALLDTDLYVDRGDVVMLEAFLKAAEGALYLLRGLDIALDYPTMINGIAEIVSDVRDGGLDFVEAIDASPFARLKVRSVSDLQNARAAFVSAFSYMATGDALVRGRTDGKEHLIQYSSGMLGEVLQAILQNKDAIIAYIDQMISPLDLGSATVTGGVLEMAYTGGPLAPTVGSVTVGGTDVPYDLTGTTSATAAGTYEMTLVGYGRSTGTKKIVWKIVIPPPGISGDGAAEVKGNATDGYVVRPSADAGDVVVTIPAGLDARKVSVEVGPGVRTVRPNGAAVRIVRNLGGSGVADITDFLNIPAPDAGGIVDLTRATVKADIVREALDPAKDAVVSMGAGEVSITTAKTRVGLVYTLVEGTTIKGMKGGDSKVGDGKPWTPAITVKGGASGFYSVHVTK